MSAWRCPAVITTIIMLLVVDFLIPFRKTHCEFHVPALWWRLNLCWLLPTASRPKLYMRTLWLMLMANCTEVKRNSTNLSNLNPHSNSKSLFWVKVLNLELFFSLIPKHVWIHPQYNLHARTASVREIYDYDVALIQLMGDVVMSTAVRWELLPMQLCLLSPKVKKVKPKSSWRLTGLEILSGSWTNWKCSLLELVKMEQHLRLRKYSDKAQVFCMPLDSVAGITPWK